MWTMKVSWPSEETAEEGIRRREKNREWNEMEGKSNLVSSQVSKVEKDCWEQ